MQPWDESNRDDRILQDLFKLESGLDVEQIRKSPMKLDRVLQHVSLRTN